MEALLFDSEFQNDFNIIRSEQWWRGLLLCIMSFLDNVDIFLVSLIVDLSCSAIWQLWEFLFYSTNHFFSDPLFFLVRCLTTPTSIGFFMETISNVKKIVLFTFWENFRRFKKNWINILKF